MQIKNTVKMIVLSIVVSTLFVGCGGSSENSSTTPDTTPETISETTPTSLTGTFVDAPVQGLAYKTATQNGFTDENGEFKYVAGEEVEFRLGNLLLGKGAAGTLLTPYSISDNNDTATNIALLLQNFDNDRTDTILNILALKDYNLSDFNLSDTNANLESKLTTLLATANFQTLRGGTNFGLIDSTTAKNAMDAFIATDSIKYDKKFTQAFIDKYPTLYSVALRDGALHSAAKVSTVNQKFLKGDSFNFDDTPGGSTPYEITSDGEMKVDWRTDGPLVYFSVGEITQDYVKAVGRVDGFTGSYVEYWYFDREKADAKVSAILKAILSNKKITLQGTDVTMEFLESGTLKRYGNDGDGVFDCVGTYEVNINVVSFEVTQCTGESGPATGTFTFNSLPVQVGTVFHHDVAWDGGSDAGNDVIATFGSI